MVYSLYFILFFDNSLIAKAICDIYFLLQLNVHLFTTMDIGYFEMFVS
jgi:hypothetical protein